MSATNDDNKEQAEKFAFTTDAVTYILSAAGCPIKFRDYIDCLIGLADGNVEFDATDKQIERRRKVIKPSNRKGVKEYWARDKRRDLLKWQKENDLVLLDYKKSDYDKKLKGRPPSHYKFYLVEYVQHVITEAKKNKLLWNSNKAITINETARRFINELRARPKAEPDKEEFINPHDEVLRKLRSAKTSIENSLRLLEKYDFELYKDDEALVAELEELIAKIRKRGFADLLDMKIFSGIEREDKP